GRQRPRRVHAGSTIQTLCSSTATASAGQTRTQARHATHSSGSILKSTPVSSGVRRQRKGALRWEWGRGLSNGATVTKSLRVCALHQLILLQLAVQRALADPQ